MLKASIEISKKYNIKIQKSVITKLVQSELACLISYILTSQQGYDVTKNFTAAEKATIFMFVMRFNRAPIYEIFVTQFYHPES